MAAHFLNILCQLVSGNQQVSEYLTGCLQSSDVSFHYKIRDPIRMEILTPRLVLPHLCIKSERRSCYRSQVPACVWLLHCHQRRERPVALPPGPHGPACLQHAQPQWTRGRGDAAVCHCCRQEAEISGAGWRYLALKDPTLQQNKTKQSKKLTSVSNDSCKPL